MSPIEFEVGKKYENMRGIYEVLALEDNAMRIRWQDGVEASTTVTLQRRIIKRMGRERQEAQSQKTRQPKTRKGKKQKTLSGENTGIQKQYLKNKKVCKVTFRLPNVVAGDAESVCIVGDFNDWNATATPMKKRKNQDYAVTLELRPGREYQYRYLIDGSKWENDWNADKYVKNPFGDSDNSVVST